MRKLIFIATFLVLFLAIFSKSTLAQGCDCVSSYKCDDTPCSQNYHYECVPETPNQCGSGKLCQCSPNYSTSPITNCTGTCVREAQCTDIGGYCVYKCGRFSRVAAPCPSDAQICCSITGSASNDTPECINNCSTSCVFGIDLPGFTCRVEIQQQRDTQTKVCVCYPPGQIPGEVIPFDPCKDIKDSSTKEACRKCVGTPEEPTGDSWTALGCITTSSPQEFIAWLLKSVIGIAGGIAFLLMLWGGFQIITSTGDPEKLNKGKEILTSAIIGLVVIIFSVFLLKLIGVDILQLPGFEK